MAERAGGDAPVALVTGAGRGIGAATARALHGDGWRLVLLDRAADDPTLAYSLASPKQLAAVGEACGASAGEAATVVGDVRDQGAVDGAVALAVDRFGRLDAAVAAAGAVLGGPTTWETGDDAWHAMVGTNLEGVWRVARAAVPALLDRPEPRQGRFVAVSSSGGTLGLPRLAAYAAAKHGVEGLVRSLAAELGDTGVTANCVAPGSTVGPMVDASAAVYGVAPDDLAEHHLQHRLLRPEEVAEAIRWLCSPAASAVTGAVLAVDAGMTAG